MLLLKHNACISLTEFNLKYSFNGGIIMKSNYWFTQLSTFDYFNVIFNATLLNLLVYKEEEKNTQKLVKLLGVIFFSLELNCLVIWRIFFSRQSCCRSRSRAHRQLWLNAFILFIFAVALAGLAYYTMTLQNQLAILTIHLDPGKSCKLFFQCTEVRFAIFLSGECTTLTILLNLLD